MIDRWVPRSEDERPIVVVDVESTGLDVAIAIPVEVAWWNLATGERGEFVPRHDCEWVIKHAEPGALEVNGYMDRLLLAEQDDGRGVARLAGQLAGASLAGANPASLDAPMLAKLMAPTWHYRMYDVANIARTELNLRWLPGLRDVAVMLGEPQPDHSAAADVTSAGRCLLRLFEMGQDREQMMGMLGRRVDWQRVLDSSRAAREAQVS